MNYEKLVRKVQTAGTWFTGVFLREILRNYPVIVNDKKKRKEFIDYFHNEYGVNCEYEYSTTQTKCYDVIEIIKRGKVLDALEYILTANDKKVPAEAWEAANSLLDDIVKNIIVLPDAIPETEDE